MKRWFSYFCLVAMLGATIACGPRSTNGGTGTTGDTTTSPTPVATQPADEAAPGAVASPVATPAPTPGA